MLYIHCLALLPIFRPDEHSLVSDDDGVGVRVLPDCLPDGGLGGHVDDGDGQLLVHAVVPSQLLVVDAPDGALVPDLELRTRVDQRRQNRVLAVGVQHRAATLSLCQSKVYVNWAQLCT